MHQGFFAFQLRLSCSNNTSLPSSLSNMHIDTTVDAAIQTADLVVEAVVENMELKQKLFAEYDDKVMIVTMMNPSSSKPSLRRPQQRPSLPQTLLLSQFRKSPPPPFAWTGHHLPPSPHHKLLKMVFVGSHPPVFLQVWRAPLFQSGACDETFGGCENPGDL